MPYSICCNAHTNFTELDICPDCKYYCDWENEQENEQENDQEEETETLKNNIN
jgi:hypothetical protein